MRCLRKNMVPFWYSLRIDETETTDENGFLSGEIRTSYSAPLMMCANISPAANTAVIQQFGTDIRYDKVIVMDDPAFPMDEHSLLRLNQELQLDESGYMIPDHIITRVSRSLNSVSYAIRQVDVR